MTTVKGQDKLYSKNILTKKFNLSFKDLKGNIDKKLLNGCANITGGGLADNIKRVIPDKLCAEINLDNIKILKIFKWLKRNNISDHEMLRTFNCGVGFCLIIEPKNFKKVLNFFPKKYKPYVIGKITKRSNKIKLNDKIDWR